MELGHPAIAPNKIYRAARAIALIALAATVIVGLLHTKLGKPLLAKMGGCPAGFATRDDMDKMRKYAVTMAPVGSESAPARPALGFTLDTTTEDDLHAWAKKNNVSCKDNDRLGHITCENVASALIGDTSGVPVQELTIEFDPAHRAVNILALRHGLSSMDAVRVFEARLAALEKELGPAPGKHTPTGPDYFNLELLQSATANYNFKDYQSELAGVTMMDRTVTLREHYFSTR